MEIHTLLVAGPARAASKDGCPFVGGGACQGGFEGRLSVCELTHDIDDVVVVAAHHYLVSVLRYQQYTVIQFRTRDRALYYHAHRVVGTVLGLEYILVLGVGDIHHVAEFGAVDGQGHEIFVSRPHEAASVGRKTMVRMIGSHSAEGVGVADGKTRHTESDAGSYRHGEHRMVAYQPDRVGGLDLGDDISLSAALEARPVYHPSGRSLEQGHDLGLRLPAEIILRKVRHVLVGHEMDDAGVLGNLRGEGSRCL